MRVFISSVIAGFGEFRAAAAQAAVDLGHEVLRAESLTASDATPEQACLALERSADVAVVLLGARYGPIQRSGLSATHEEYRDARERMPVLVFAQEGMSAEDAQRAFIAEVREWAGGRFSGSFSSPEALRAAVTRGLHELAISRAGGQADAAETAPRAHDALRTLDVPGRHALALAVAGGPRQQILRPAQLEDQIFRDSMLQRAMFGATPIFDSRAATEDHTDRGVLVIEQARSQLRLYGDGTVVVVDPTLRRPPPAGLLGGMVLIEEDVRDGIALSLRFIGSLLDEIDPTRRLPTVSVSAALVGAQHTAWRTRADHAANPNTMNPNMFAPDRVVADLPPPARPRAALTHQAEEIAVDLMVLVRRELRQR